MHKVNVDELFAGKQSKYALVVGVAKRAREIIDGQEPMVAADPKKKPLSIAVDEVYHGKVKIVGADED